MLLYETRKCIVVGTITYSASIANFLLKKVISLKNTNNITLIRIASQEHVIMTIKMNPGTSDTDALKDGLVANLKRCIPKKRSRMIVPMKNMLNNLDTVLIAEKSPLSYRSLLKTINKLRIQAKMHTKPVAINSISYVLSWRKT